MILTRSPYYWNVVLPNAFCTSVDYRLDIGTGTLASPALLRAYPITKIVPSSDTTSLNIDIAPLIRDFYTFSPLTFSGSSNEVQSSPLGSVLIADIDSAFVDTLGSTAGNVTQKFVCTDGYGYYLDNANFTPAKKILLSNDEYRADTRGYFVVPLQCSGGEADPTVNGVPVPLNYVEGTTSYVRYLVIAMANYTSLVTVVFEGETIVVEPIDECRYDVNEVQFINRYGVIEVMHFYKAQKESYQTTGERFKNNFVTGTSYDAKVHQIKKYNVFGNKKLTIETGFLPEQYNQTVQELMETEHAWMQGRPINVTTESLEFKTGQVDKLISYSVEFEYAYDEITNV